MNSSHQLNLNNTMIDRSLREWKPGQKKARTIRRVVVFSEGRFQEPVRVLESLR